MRREGHGIDLSWIGRTMRAASITPRQRDQDVPIAGKTKKGTDVPDRSASEGIGRRSGEPVLDLEAANATELGDIFRD